MRLIRNHTWPVFIVVHPRSHSMNDCVSFRFYKEMTNFWHKYAVTCCQTKTSRSICWHTFRGSFISPLHSFQKMFPLWNRTETGLPFLPTLWIKWPWNPICRAFSTPVDQEMFGKGRVNWMSGSSHPHHIYHITNNTMHSNLLRLLHSEGLATPRSSHTRPTLWTSVWKRPSFTVNHKNLHLHIHEETKETALKFSEEIEWRSRSGKRKKHVRSTDNFPITIQPCCHRGSLAMEEICIWSSQHKA